MEYILIFISAIFVNNIVLSQFLGICPFLGVSKKVDTALGMSAAVAFVLTIATIVTFLIQKFVLDAFDLGYLQADDYFHSGDCRSGADGGNYIKEGISLTVSGIGCISAVDHYQLLYFGCSYSGNPERL